MRDEEPRRLPPPTLVIRVHIPGVDTSFVRYWPPRNPR
ncbi:hypothetical protein HSB1_34990 [Halogranum salarium B-1]|uniref:Uncharacterized protein n=1 Tax=Halogranum salarium B-1 TaxID=1210908 RepID=J3EUK0_9EURY|nr:hypothetical protein HSB1_34990 [Halogranum salarium B-1]